MTRIYIEFLMGHIGLEYIRAMGLDILNTPLKLKVEAEDLKH